MKANQMNGLYPIIRRVRRPLVIPVEDRREVTAGGADAKPAEAKQAAAAVQAGARDSAKEKANDGKAGREQAGK